MTLSRSFELSIHRKDSVNDEGLIELNPRFLKPWIEYMKELEELLPKSFERRSEEFFNQIKYEVEYKNDDYTRYWNMKFKMEDVLPWLEYMQQMEALLPPRYPFTPRGIGLEYLACSFCGPEAQATMQSDMANFVWRDDKYLLEKLFNDAGVKLHFRGDFQSHPQVKISACDKHKVKLERLYNLIGGSGVYGRAGTISLAKLQEAVKHEEPDMASAY